MFDNNVRYDSVSKKIKKLSNAIADQGGEKCDKMSDMALMKLMTAQNVAY